MTNILITGAPRGLPISTMLAAIVLTAFMLGGCVGARMVTPEPPPIPEGGSPVPDDNEVVLADDTQLVADTGFGRIKIEAGPGLRRVFTWNGVRRGAIMKPRAKRFAGSMGIIYDGVPPLWTPAQGVTRLKYEEGRRRFENIDDAKIWMQIRRLDYTYNNSGIAVGWRQKGNTLQVELWQFYIDGKQPTQMAGADDAAITIAPLDVVQQKMSPVQVAGNSHAEPAAVGSDEESNEESWLARTFDGLFGGDKNDDTVTEKTDTSNKSNLPANAGNTPEKDDASATNDKAEKN